MKLLPGFIGVIVLISACKKEPKIYEPTPYSLDIPSHFPDMPIPADNPMTVEGVALGRKLFYETRLSLDNTIACASCHAPSKGFSDDRTFSVGVNGTVGRRQSMALVNLGWQQFFFWDGRAKTLEEQILQPVPDPTEMHLQWKEAQKRLENDLEYKRLFVKAFGTQFIDSTYVAKAIAQFLRTMISANSKYDVMYKYANNMQLTPSEYQIYQTVSIQEWAGYDLFQSLNGADCFHCHNGALMQVQRYSNNGLDATFSDLGRGAVTGNTSDNGTFKIPSLRNIEFTAPYMHDGRFSTLDEVINHYSHQIKISPTIDPMIEFAFQGGVQLDANEKSLLKAFLLTMTDHSFFTNPAFSDPN
ncbi:cytochrome-c peroxidase [Crocinitomicaceae bacterium CZZ-1]|uniref:Cytochrome-c peroxidase n=1 Tax=Taishania pollutisoli TaxID=2766479 RepID=A0A8J6U251_9FLAO|nr:cytochrome c peroxidase [Taishania pollutisoli]MBC9812145.1 cytochrome-c peroxidase [Taishania pollutisoli]